MRLREVEMEKIIAEHITRKNVPVFKEFVSFLNKNIDKCECMQRNEILMHFDDFCTKNKKSKKFLTSSLIRKFLNSIREILFEERDFVILYRYSQAKYLIYRVDKDVSRSETIEMPEYLTLKEKAILGDDVSTNPLKIDFIPFYDYSRSIRDSKKIGNGMQFLNHNMSSSLFQDPEKGNVNLFNFLTIHKLNGASLLIREGVFKDFESFFAALKKMVKWLQSKRHIASYNSGRNLHIVTNRMKKMGFEVGWGNTIDRIIETMQLLVDLVNEPASALLEEFISRIPMVSKIAVISPHGWFGQKNIWGRPDTGGQVIYILDQVRALEKHIRERFAKAGVFLKPKILVVTRLIPNAGNTTCNERLEKITGAENCWILRVPFKDSNGKTLQNWISRFKIWPYLDRFAEDSQQEILQEFKANPDLIIGNYSDGNLVATLLADKLNVIQCTIAHALEKTKYFFSDLHWKKYERDYHFTLQFVADMISMNKSNFIITSTAQEIAGTPENVGQYEEYQFFSMPGFLQVQSGINLFHPKFNIIPPGVNEKDYYPYFEEEKRSKKRKTVWEKKLFFDTDDGAFGTLRDQSKRPIFTMARLDKIKNITGLIEAFGMSKLLQRECNLVFAAGVTDISLSQDKEEQKEIRKVQQLIKKYKLKQSIRWLPGIDKADTSEVYRIIADRGGIFVQPALYEAFGLTILEALLSGLPTFATEFGGPSEIIIDNECGFLINPRNPQLMAKRIEEFVVECAKNKQYWKEISDQGIKRVREHFTWKLYSNKLITLTNLYSFWRHSVSGEGKIKMSRYCDLIYQLLFKKRAKYIEH